MRRLVFARYSEHPVFVLADLSLLNRVPGDLLEVEAIISSVRLGLCASSLFFVLLHLLLARGQICSVLSQVIRALVYMHETAKICHRDLKVLCWVVCLKQCRMVYRLDSA